MRNDVRVLIGADIAGFDMKEEVLAILDSKGYNITDVQGSNSKFSDFSDVAELLAEGIQKGEYDRGILICGTGCGMCIAANKFRGVRAGIAYDVFPAVLASADNNTNVLCTGAWVVESAAKCAKMLEAWLLVQYSGRDTEGMGRLAKIEAES